MEIAALCLCALGIGLLTALLRKQSADIAPLAATAAAVILTAALIRFAYPLVAQVSSLSDTLETARPYITVLIKALGVAITSKTCADVCRDCGENAVASKIESAGKIGILLLSLPVLKSIVGLLGQLVE